MSAYCLFDRDWEMADFFKYVSSAAGAVTVGAMTATAAAWYMMTRPRPITPRFNLNSQSIPVPVSLQ